MKHLIFPLFLFFVLISFIASAQNEKRQWNINDCEEELKRYTSQFDSAKTIFVKEEGREMVSRYFIDENRNSEMYSRIDQSYLSKEELASISESIKELKDSSKNSVNQNKINIPKKWVELHQYKNKYYVYKPSDGMYNPTYSFVDDSTFVKLGGMWDVQMVSKVSKRDAKTYIFDMVGTSYYNSFDDGIKSKIIKTEIVIHFIDLKKQIALWDFYIWGERCQVLMIPLDRIKDYPLIVNNQSCMKCPFEFNNWDKIDFNKYTKK